MAWCGISGPNTVDIAIRNVNNIPVADAPIEAATRVDAMLESGDLDGRAVWRRILKAVEELLSEERSEGAKVH